jgi:hypothetical protein
MVWPHHLGVGRILASRGSLRRSSHEPNSPELGHPTRWSALTMTASQPMVSPDHDRLASGVQTWPSPASDALGANYESAAH